MRTITDGFRQKNQTIITDPNVIIDFLEGNGKDYRGRTFHSMIESDDKELEICNDKIQFMFPLHEESNFASVYPIVTKELIEKVKDNKIIKDNLILASKRMLSFYGIDKKPFNIYKVSLWSDVRNHNLLRITRIIRSLRLFGLEETALDFYERVCKAVKDAEIYNIYNYEIDQEAPSYWKKAMYDPIWKTLR